MIGVLELDDDDDDDVDTAAGVGEDVWLTAAGEEIETDVTRRVVGARATPLLVGVWTTCDVTTMVTGAWLDAAALGDEAAGCCEGAWL